MANKRSFCFIIAFHNFATLENWLTYQCPSSWPVVITMKKKLAGTWKTYRILAGPNQWQQVCNRSNPEKNDRSCEGAHYGWLSAKASRTFVGHTWKPYDLTRFSPKTSPDTVTTHPHLPVRANNEQFLPAGSTFRHGLAGESKKCWYSPFTGDPHQ